MERHFSNKYFPLGLFFILTSIFLIQILKDENAFRQIMGIVNWFVFYPTLVVGSAVCYRNVKDYYKSKVDFRKFVYTIPLLIFIILFLFKAVAESIVIIYGEC